jgi:hypothetical protein
MATDTTTVLFPDDLSALVLVARRWFNGVISGKNPHLGMI